MFTEIGAAEADDVRTRLDTVPSPAPQHLHTSRKTGAAS
ncbi:hypothetical protein C6N75_27645 [Streptomyces solincola]|uniref:Uncharacterized protein n=1 Tax=Streptomyces solincola TaxID=2100817 RepID=A0A2S9PNR4_9ACTN|nr:hypothetical protein C6N75_27645 [Streptomyces solincola]